MTFDPQLPAALLCVAGAATVVGRRAVRLLRGGGAGGGGAGGDGAGGCAAGCGSCPANGQARRQADGPAVVPLDLGGRRGPG